MCRKTQPVYFFAYPACFFVKRGREYLAFKTFSLKCCLHFKKSFCSSTLLSLSFILLQYAIAISFKSTLLSRLTSQQSSVVFCFLSRFLFMGVLLSRLKKILLLRSIIFSFSCRSKLVFLIQCFVGLFGFFSLACLEVVG